MSVILNREGTMPRGLFGKINTWDPKNIVKLGHSDLTERDLINIRSRFGYFEFEIDLADFLYLVVDVLTATRLYDDDPRLKFVEIVRAMEIEEYNRNSCIPIVRFLNTNRNPLVKELESPRSDPK